MRQVSENTKYRLRHIEGRHNAWVKRLRLAFAHAGQSTDGDCAIEGLRIVEEAIRSGLKFSAVFFRESAEERAERLLPQIGAHVETLLLPDRLFDSVVRTESPQGVAALVRLKAFSLEDVFERLQLGPVVVMVGLQDPGNLGTILRSAEAFGSAGIVIGEGTVSPFNAKAIRASAGSAFRLPVVGSDSTVGGIKDLLSRLRAQKIRLIATTSHKGVPIGEADLETPFAGFVGSEGSGLPREMTARMDEVVVIPHAPQVESLNAGVAASILLYEAAKRREIHRL